MYRLDPRADTVGITGMGEIEVAPARLVERFGPPQHGDGSKVSGEYVFVDRAGEVFVLHDWKSTNLWESGWPTPEEFWASAEPEELTISTRDVATAEFEAWLVAQL